MMMNNDGEEKKEDQKKEEYIEKRKFFYCMQLKTGVIIFGVFLFLYLVLESINLFIIFFNETFDFVYALGYFICLLPLITGACIYTYYYVSEDSPKSRKWLPWAHLLSFITTLLLILWIIIYIGLIYNRESVYVNRWDREVNPSVEDLGDDRTK